MPEEPEVHGLTALLEFQASRIAARTGPDGEPVLLAGPEPRPWDRLLIRRGFDALRRARSAAPGPYAVQAAIAACHARRVPLRGHRLATIAALYGRLAALVPSPVVELNRAVAVSMAQGPEAGLALVDALAGGTGAEGLPLAAERARRPAGTAGAGVREARTEFERAASLTRNERERELLLERASRCGP